MMKKQKFGRGGVTIPLPPSDREKAAKAKAAKAKAAKDKAEDARYRKHLGSDEEIVARGNRSQAMEAAEARYMGIGKAKGGNAVKKYAAGGITKILPTSKEMGNMNMMKKGGAVKKMAKGGSASARADGIAKKGKTKGKVLAAGGIAGRPAQTGLARAAAMSGRTMPTRGSDRVTTMKKGGRAKGACK